MRRNGPAARPAAGPAVVLMSSPNVPLIARPGTWASATFMTTEPATPPALIRNCAAGLAWVAVSTGAPALPPNVALRLAVAIWRTGTPCWS